MNRYEALRVLGLDEDASDDDIKLAYKEMAQILHPDKFTDNRKLAERATEQFKRVNEAREVLLGRRASARRGAGKSGSAGAAGRGGSGRAGRSSGDGSGGADSVSALKARLAGIAAARVQLTAQLDAETDRRRIGIYLTLGGLVLLVVGSRIRQLLVLAGPMFIWGIIQLFSSQANIKVIRGHLEALDAERQRCAAQL
jgi:DnaJ-class molecular chaperone